MDLTEVLGEDLAKQVSEKLGDEYEFINKKDGGWIPKAKFNEKLSEAKDLQKQLEAVNSKIADLDKFTNENQELKIQLDKIKQDNEMFKVETEKRLTNEKKRFKLREDLLKSGVKESYIDFVETKFNIESLEFDGEKIIGFNDKLNPLKENYKEIFAEVKERGYTPERGNASPKEKDFITKEQFNKMTPEEKRANIDKINKSYLEWDKTKKY